MTGADGEAEGVVERRAEVLMAGAGVIGTDRTGRAIGAGGVEGAAGLAREETEAEADGVEDTAVGADGAVGVHSAAGGVETVVIVRAGEFLRTTVIGRERTRDMMEAALVGGREEWRAGCCTDTADGEGVAAAAETVEVGASWTLDAEGGVTTTVGTSLLAASA